MPRIRVGRENTTMRQRMISRYEDRRLRYLARQSSAGKFGRYDQYGSAYQQLHDWVLEFRRFMRCPASNMTGS